MRRGPRSRARSQRGQVLALTALVMLLLVVATFLTFSIGYRVREKVKLQAAADASAYSMAVAEARALNFYAWSNRALVAHQISLLSIHAHQSYLTWYEDMLLHTVYNFSQIRDTFAARCAGGNVCACGARDRATKVMNTFLNAGKGLDFTVGCESGDITACDDDGKAHGALWFHEEWHAKDSSNFCAELVMAGDRVITQVHYLRAHQLQVEAELRRLFGQTLTESTLEADAMSSSGQTPSSAAARFRNVEGIRERPSLPTQLSARIDPALVSERDAEDATDRHYTAAVSDGLASDSRSRRHRDYDEVLAATRYPTWLTRREYFLDQNMRRLLNLARRVSGSDVVDVTPWATGTTKMARIASDASDPGMAGENVQPVSVWWVSGLTVPSSGLTLAGLAHDNDHDGQGFGQSDAVAAEDHGWVRSVEDPALCAGASFRTEILVGRNGVWSDPHDADGYSPAHSSIHFFHSHTMGAPRHGLFIGDDTQAMPVLRGVYRGHMRFVLGPSSQLFNLPHTVAVISRPTNAQRFPWDFEFRASLPGPVSYTTLDSAGDLSNGRKMGAIAGGLVYYHQPEAGGVGYRAAPNLWNPFWRAKLHPVDWNDALDSLRNRFPESNRAASALGAKAINY